MCLAAVGEPAVLRVSYQLGLPNSILCYKCLTLSGSGIHQSGMGLQYPLGEMVIDHKAVVGDHDRCIHFFPTYESAQQSSYATDSAHIVAIAIPLGNYWTMTRNPGNEPTCWHASKCFPVWCYTCQSGVLEPSSQQLKLNQHLPARADFARERLRARAHHASGAQLRAGPDYKKLPPVRRS
jgi:hypothetical protein